MSAQSTEYRPSLNWLVAAILAVWLALVLVLGANGAFVQPPGAPPLPLLLGAAVPLTVFLAAYGGSGAFRAWTLAVDLPLVTAVQAWRFAGLGFIALAANGVLPRVFAWPAGFGDMAIGLTAPWVALALVRSPEGGYPAFAASRLFVGWNLLGVLDLVVAASTAALSLSLAAGAPGEVTMAPMTQLPLVLVPAYLVPLLLMLHLAALFQARRLAHPEEQAAHSDRLLSGRVSA